MKISTKGRYALIFMLDLISNEEGKPVPLKETAKRQDVPEKYLEQIAGTLVKSGLVRGIRGKNGGYFLRWKPEDYTVGEVLRIMEGDLAPAPCVEISGSTCKRKEKCASVVLWEKLNKAVNDVVDNITLADMYGWQQDNSNKVGL